MDVVLFIAILIGIFFLALLLQLRLIKRAGNQIIEIFRSNNAITAKSAMSQVELGLAPKSILSRFIGGRDFKPQALQNLISMGIVDYTEEGLLYLDEDKLVAGAIGQRHR